MAPKKIYYLANIRLPTEKTHGLQVMKTCEALARRGIAVELILPTRVNHIPTDPFVFYGVEKNFTITKLPQFDFLTWKFLGSFGYWLNSFFFCQKLQKYLQNKNDGAFYSRDLPIVYWLGKKLRPMIYEIHTLPIVAGARYKKAWQRASGFVVISKGLLTDLIHFGVRSEKITIARDGADVSAFTNTVSPAAAREQLGIQNDHKVVVYTGHLYEWKGADTLAKAVKYLPNNARVYLVGGTHQDAERFKELYQHARLYVVGWRRHSEIPLWLAAADVLVLPNSNKEKIGSHYTSPLKAFEYLASGRPIVASNVPALHEVFGENDAVFYEPDNEKSLAQAIQSVLDKPPVLPEQLLRSRSSSFDWSKRAEIIDSFIFAK